MWFYSAPAVPRTHSLARGGRGAAPPLAHAAVLHEHAHVGRAALGEVRGDGGVRPGRVLAG